MKSKFLVLTTCLLLIGANLSAQQAEIIKFDRLNDIIGASGDQVAVINFWATWCGPCVKELPHFEAVAKENEGVTTYLISLDYGDQIDRVNKFIEKRGITSKVMILDEIDYNSWIDRVDSTWSGAIPATLIINQQTGERKFVEKEMEKSELEHIIEELTH